MDQLALSDAPVAPSGDLRAHAREMLRTALGRSDADFRDGQWEAIESLVERQAKLLVVQRTGWGKSSVYFLTTRLLRERGAGPTVLISPLLALMRDQVRAAARLGVRAVTINSTNVDEWGDVRAQLDADEVDVLLVSPERLANEGFREAVLDPLLGRCGLFVVDEAHCISDWGHDFRPDYRRIKRLLPQLPAGVAVLATTATANDAVVRDVSEQLGGVEVVRGPLARPSLQLQAIHLRTEGERMAWLAEHLPQLPGSGIVYVLTKGHAHRVAGYLRAQGVDAHAYTGGGGSTGVTEEQKLELERRLLANEIKAVVATPALGMGFDKPDLAFVVHFQMPQSLIHYYQQVGRAGRAVDDALGVLLHGDGDRRITDFFVAQAFPPAAVYESVLTALRGASGGLGSTELAKRAGVGRSLTEKVLTQLAVSDDPAVRRSGRVWKATGAAGGVDTSRFDELTARRHDEQERMQRYADGEVCLMQFVTAELDDPVAAPCGRCSVCVGRAIVGEAADATMAQAATAYEAPGGRAAGGAKGRGRAKARTTRSRAKPRATADGAAAPASRTRTKKRRTTSTPRLIERSTAIGLVDQALRDARGVGAGTSPEQVLGLSDYRTQLERDDARQVDRKHVLKELDRILRTD